MSWTFDRAAYERRVEWYVNARFGLFLHWGLYAIPGRGEWVRSVERIPNEEYDPLMARFDPKCCDMRAWMALAKGAGMKYAVLTAKHHDGFCLFDSAYTDFKSTNSPAGRDFVREFLDAAREAGLRAGLYFSLLDWRHPDFPHCGDRHHPMRGDPAYPDGGRDFGRYLEFMHAQVRELCSNYGKLDLLWFDFSYDDMRGEKWRAAELMEMVRALQPDVVVDNRLEVSGEGFGSLAACRPTPFHGDFVSPECFIPPHGLKDAEGRPLVWESCVTMNDHWGYCPADRFYKPASLLIRKLVECVSKGGNLLLNVGPDPTGQFPAEARAVLREMGSWMEKNGDSIYGCGPSGLDKPEFGRYTRKGDRLYVHVFENTIGPLPLIGVERARIRGARRLADGKPLSVSTSWVHSDYPDLTFLDLGPDPRLYDPIDTVLEVELDGQ